MDQPYSRIADALLDRQYWAPDDPQKHPYDDTGWSFPDLFGVPTVRVTDASILKAKMGRWRIREVASGAVNGHCRCCWRSITPATFRCWDCGTR